MRHRRLRVLVAGLVLLLAVGVAHAGVIVQTKHFSMEGPSGASDLETFVPFDPAIGVLESASFSIYMQLIVTTLPSPIVDPYLGILPVPIGGQAKITLKGVGWSFSSSTTCQMAVVVVPSNQAMRFPIVPYVNWKSDGESDLLGMTMGGGSSDTCVTYPLNTVERNDYLATPVTDVVGLMTLMQFSWEPWGTKDALTTVAGGATAMLQYNYAPFPVVTVSEPPVMPLLGGGLLCLLVADRLRRGRRAPRSGAGCPGK
ncbi:MAG TPA: hypothetical protein VFX04_05790 [Rhodanobacteraceae bacterium]|nr:hypothetical protein [Rhodanobacteraceae bacterium]